MTTYTLRTNWERPPLTLNSRFDFPAQQWEMVRDARMIGKILGLQLYREVKRTFQKGEVQMHYRPVKNVRRDPSNLVATQKPFLDGLVDAKVFPDDSSKYVKELMPVIHPADDELGPQVWFTVTVPDGKPADHFWAKLLYDMPADEEVEVMEIADFKALDQAA